jgi:hypothetical protein
VEREVIEKQHERNDDVSVSVEGPEGPVPEEQEQIEQQQTKN